MKLAKPQETTIRFNARLFRPKSVSENSKGACFRAKSGMARRDEGAYPPWVCDREATKPACSLRENPPGGGSFRSGLRCSLLTDHCGYARRSRLGWSENLSPQAPFQFSDTL
jgi:hypothetical protein